MFSFLGQEQNLIDTLKDKYPDYSGEFVSFINSKYISRSMIEPLLICTNLDEAKPVIENISQSALSSFISNYFDAVHSAMNSIDSEISELDIQSILSNKDLLHHWKELLSQEPFFEWLISEGIVLFNEAKKHLMVGSIEELAELIFTLNYLGSFLAGHSTYTDIGILYDIPQWLLSELEKHNLIIPKEQFDHQEWQKRFVEGFMKSLWQKIEINFTHQDFKLTKKIDDYSMKLDTSKALNMDLPTIKKPFLITGGKADNADKETDRSSNPAA